MDHRVKPGGDGAIGLGLLAPRLCLAPACRFGPGPGRRLLRRRPAARRGSLAPAGHLALRQRPAFPVDVEDDAVRVPELALEIVVVRIAEIEEELSARGLDLLLLLLDVVALEAEMMDADELARLLQPGAGLALVLQQRQVDLAVAHIDAERGRPFRLRRTLEPERLLVEIRRGVDVLHR